MDTPITRAEHNEFCRRMEEEHSRQNARISDIETGLNEVRAISVSIGRLATNMENMAKEQERQGKEQEKQGERLDALEGRDGEMWRKVIGCVITAAIGAVFGFVFSRIGM